MGTDSPTSPQEIAAKLASHEAFRQTDDEETRCNVARTLADPNAWRGIVASCISPILHSYSNGELSLGDAVDILGRIAIGCWPQDRVQLLGLLGALALRITPRKLKPGEKTPLYPSCIKSGTADLVLVLKDRQPDKRRAPTAYDPTSPIITEALQVLTTIRWFGDAPTPQPATIDHWVRTRIRELLERSARQGSS